MTRHLLEASSDREYPSILPAAQVAGVGMHITSLPGPHGIGDIGDSALTFVDTLGSMGLSVWQFLPTGPTAYGDSPYQPLSAFAGNEMLIGLDPLFRLGLLRPEEAAQLTGFTATSVDYGALIPSKRRLLELAASRFHATASGEVKAEYEDFLHAHGHLWLDDYAAYRVLKAVHGEKPWPEWDAACVRREPAAMQKLRKDNSQAIEDVKVTQFLFERQWQTLRRYASGRGIRLFGDMPIYIALDSADAWAHPEILLIDRNGRPSHVAGVPPDYFSADGQLWGNPLYDWRSHEAGGYQWWIERMRHAMGQADLVRIDHFRGFEAFWSVEFGAETARDGEWLPGPGNGIFNAMRAALGNLPIVAEDLGVITPEVEELRHRQKFPGMKVLQFMVGDPDFRLDDIEELCVCYTGTHDNDTTVGWFNGGDGGTRTTQEIHETQLGVLRLTGGSPATVHLDMIRLAFATKARLAVAPMQDFLGLGSEARFNIPGTTANNWRWRASEEQLAPALCTTIAEWVAESSRN